MKVPRFISLLCIALSISCGSEDDNGPGPQCVEDADCINGFECVENFCREIPEETPVCMDNDGDGYGTGETLEDRQACAECENFGRCAEDCDDTDPEISPASGCPED